MKHNTLILELEDMCRTLKQFNITHVTKKVNERKFELMQDALVKMYHPTTYINLSGYINITVDGVNITIVKYKLFQNEKEIL